MIFEECDVWENVEESEAVTNPYLERIQQKI